MDDLLQPASLDALENLAEEPPGGPLLVICCRYDDLASAAAARYAQMLLGGRASAGDLHRLAPADASWRAAEIEGVADAVRLQPEHLHVVILEKAGSLDPRLADRLLVLFEEPGVAALFILCVQRPGDLPATLRGRAWRELVLEPLGSAQRAARLVADGVTPTAAEQAVTMAGSLVTVAGTLARSADTRALARDALAPALAAEHPVRAALAKLAKIRELAAVLADDGTQALDARALERGLIELWLEHRRRVAVADLGSGPGPVAAELDAQDLLRRRLGASVGQNLAVAEFAVRAPALAVTRRASRPRA